jgi:hypothetical protein
MSDNPGTRIVFRYSEISATVTSTQNLSPDLVDTVLNDLRRQVIAGARQLGMTYIADEAEEDAEQA